MQKDWDSTQATSVLSTVYCTALTNKERDGRVLDKCGKLRAREDNTKARARAIYKMIKARSQTDKN